MTYKKTFLIIGLLLLVTSCSAHPSTLNSPTIQGTAAASVTASQNSQMPPSKPSPTSATPSRDQVLPSPPVASEIGKAIGKFQNDFGIPNLAVFFIEETQMVNSPTGDLKVIVFQDSAGRKYSILPRANRVVEIDARSIQSDLPANTVLLSKEEIKSKAVKSLQAAVPDFSSLVSFLKYEEGGKGSNSSFTWRGKLTPGTMNSPFVQIVLRNNGDLVAFYNTLLLEK